MPDLATVLDLVVAVAVVVGVVFGLAQLRDAERSRRDHAAVDIVRTVQTQEVRRAVDLVFTLSDAADPQLVRDNPAMLEAALAVDSACEMWGAMVYEGVVDLHMLDRMVGGWVRGTWKRLRVWVEAERVVSRNPNVGEWWQWLFDRLEADPDPGKASSAYLAYRGRSRR